MKPLTIYKASAGSGKTYRLAMDYINLLLNDPTAYESILAVTFTNKATAEMKRRILMELWAVTQNEERSIIERRKAGQALTLLLDNYHFFRVQTIDTFFQAVLRNLAKELQLNANLKVSLSNDEVVSEAVDDLIDTLAEDKKLRRVVMNYVSDSMKEGRKWNVISDIKDFGNTIFKELYKANRKRLDEVFENEHFFDEYRKKLQELRDSVGTTYSDAATKVLDEMRSRGLTIDHFAKKDRGPISYFLKLQDGRFNDDANLMNKTVCEAMDDATKWYTKANAGNAALTLFVEDVILPAMAEIERTRHGDAVIYNSANVTLRHLNDMRLLARIEDSAHNLNEAAQRFMLSDTQSLLHEIMGEDDAPFVFEKIGSRLKHVMIDEFQDTSTVQWKNFLTLLKECMSTCDSTGGEKSLCNNLIVGDVKQSIYRFRSGDWRLLNNLEDEFGTQCEVETLKTNWRSWKNVVNFNNVFLREVADAEIAEIADEKWQADLRRAYSDVEQKVAERNEKTGGLVHIELLPSEQTPETPEKVHEIISHLLEKGVRQSDIAVLVRKKSEVCEIADYLEEQGLHVLSAEAFRLDASQNVLTIVNAMKVLARPKDELAKAYITLTAPDVMTQLEEQRQTLVQKTLHDLAEHLISIIGSYDPAFVTAFFDRLETFTNDISPVLEDFIEAWDENLCGDTIETTSGDGITIMTIHKSKGLEFNHVIVPYCNWDGNPPFANTLWVEPKVAPFSDLPLVPVDYRNATSLSNTIYEADGMEEYIQSVVDNFNLLYVAMTRPRHTLFVIGERGSKNFKRSRLMEQAILKMSERKDIEGVELHVSGLDDNDEPLSITYGRLEVKKPEDKTKTKTKTKMEGELKPEGMPKNPFALPEEAEVMTSLPTYCPMVDFRQSVASQRFSVDDDAYEKMRARIEGTEQHWIFSHIRTLDDVPPEYEEAFSNELVRQWYDPHWKVFNECSIITAYGEYRPDRVISDGKQTIVIDFKFGSPHDGYKKQVRNYMNLLSRMGYPNVQGYLWYVTTNEIVLIHNA